jgi:23S rRNA pseudouridine2604 synthase
MNTPDKPMTFPMRLNKYLAHTGVSSRREADTLIEKGQVLINGNVAALGTQVQDGDDVIIKGKTPKKQYLAYYKGRGIISHSPEAGEQDIATQLEKTYGLRGIHPVGRLDKDSEGLMILTNDGRLTGPLLDPASSNEKEYDVLVDKPLTGMAARIMAGGVDIEGYQTKPAEVTRNPKNDKRFKIVLTEGKKHQIRRMCAAVGYQVQSLKRVRVMNVELGELKPNQFRKISGDELGELAQQLGITL